MHSWFSITGKWSMSHRTVTLKYVLSPSRAKSSLLTPSSPLLFVSSFPIACLHLPRNLFHTQVSFTVIGREDIKVLFIGSHLFPSTRGPACKTTHAATLPQEPHYPLAALCRVFITISKISQIFGSIARTLA